MQIPSIRLEVTFHWSLMSRYFPKSHTKYALAAFGREEPLAHYIPIWEPLNQGLNQTWNDRTVSSGELIEPIQGKHNVFWHCFWQMEIKQTLATGLQLTICKIKEGTFLTLSGSPLAFLIKSAEEKKTELLISLYNQLAHVDKGN